MKPAVDASKSNSIWSVSIWALAVLLGAVNLLFMGLVGRWLVVTGAGCVAVLAVMLAMGITGRVEKARWCLHLLAALTIMNFNGWGFSYLGNLIFYLGLYFFPLFGLIMGAAIFRFLEPLRPMSRPVIVGVGMVFVLVSWCGALDLEATYVPKNTYAYYIGKFKRLPDGMTGKEVESKIQDAARKFLTENYDSDGAVAYLAWAMSDGTMEIPVIDRDKTTTYSRPQRRVGLWIRLGASLVLLVFGVFSQLVGLQRSPSTASGPQELVRPELGAG